MNVFIQYAGSPCRPSHNVQIQTHVGVFLGQWPWHRPGWQHNQDRKRPKGVAGAAVCPEHTHLNNAPTASHGHLPFRKGPHIYLSPISSPGDARTLVAVGG